MQPTTAANKSTPAQPAPKPAPPAKPASGSDVFSPSIVGNIPIKTPAGQAKAPDEDSELDQIMQDVGRELKKDTKPAKKHHFFHRGGKQETDVKFSAQPMGKLQAADKKPMPPAMPPARPQPAPVHKPQPAQPQPQTQPKAQHRPESKIKHQAKPKAPAKPKSDRSYPVLVILLTVLVTGALITAAYYTYK